MSKNNLDDLTPKVWYKSLIYKEDIIEYKVISSIKYKKITIKHDENFQLLVLSPYHVHENYLENFVKCNIDKMMRAIDNARKTHLLDLNHNQMYIFGKRYKLIRQLTNKKSKIILKNLNSDQIFFYVGQAIGNNLKKQRQYIYQQVKIFSSDYLKKRVYYFCDKFNLEVSDVKIKILKRKWGWCSAKKVIALNALLIAFDLDVIDHVICHELAHLTHLNHSKEFQTLLRQYDPNTDKILKKIKFQLD
ncbi:YgjP-like metallopeptidase [[Mycoplasma] cavipharyngis]|uniref:M48 family metallopeptidase n=1 Tax=[Mycoplasma] cavipharyngis TaxID=92757 RepID=UPI003704A876